MNSDWETFQAAFLRAPLEIKDLITSNEVGDFIMNNNPGLNSDLTKKIGQDMTDILIGLKDASYLSVYAESGILNKDKVDQMTDWLLTKIVSDKKIKEGEILKSGLRTMQSDSSEPTYTSTQAAILSESRNRAASDPATPPPQTNPNTPRWDTDR
jgi:hypothetical protein